MIAIEWDPVTFVNLLLCIAIVALGIICWSKSLHVLPLYIATAFGLFGISHTAVLLGFRDTLTLPLIAVRALAYLIVIWALVVYLKECLAEKETQDS